jgi:hypothetical protein
MKSQGGWLTSPFGLANTDGLLAGQKRMAKMLEATKTNRGYETLTLP